MMGRLVFAAFACGFVYFWGLPYVCYSNENPSYCVYHGLQGIRTLTMQYDLCPAVKIFPLRYPIIGSSDDSSFVWHGQYINQGRAR